MIRKPLDNTKKNCGEGVVKSYRQNDPFLSPKCRRKESTFISPNECGAPARSLEIFEELENHAWFLQFSDVALRHSSEKLILPHRNIKHASDHVRVSSFPLIGKLHNFIIFFCTRSDGNDVSFYKLRQTRPSRLEKS